MSPGTVVVAADGLWVEEDDSVSPIVVGRPDQHWMHQESRGSTSGVRMSSHCDVGDRETGIPCR